MLKPVNSSVELNYKVLPPKYPGPYYDNLMIIHTVIKEAKEYWFSRSARVINDLLIKIDSSIFNMLYRLEKYGSKIPFEFSEETLLKCFKKPPYYNGKTDWKELKLTAKKAYAEVNKLLAN